MSPRKRHHEHWFHRWKRPWRKPWRDERLPGRAVMLTSDGSYMPAPSWSFPDGLELVYDPSPARWVEESLPRYPWATVGALVPDCFESYVRILHPAYDERGPERRPVRWSEVAAMTGRTLHPLAQFTRLADVEDDLNGRPEWGERPDEGDLPREVAGPLERVLRDFTQTPDGCWFCVWYGYGNLGGLIGYDEEDYVHVKTPGREYLLLRGALEMERGVRANHGQGPNIWWPDDHSWCVATEVDLDSTYVGGTAECIAGLIDDPELETLPATLQDSVAFTSDTINVSGD